MRGIAVFFIFLFGVVSVSADDSDKKLNRIKAEINSVTGNIEQIKRKQSIQLKELAELEKNYGQASVLLNRLQKQIDEQQNTLQKVREESAQLQRQINSQNNGLESQIKAAYAMGRSEKLKLMLNQEDPARSSRMLVYYDYLNKVRLTRIKQIETAVSRLAELEDQKQKETVQMEKAILLKKAEQDQLSETRKQRKVLLAQLDRAYSSGRQRLRQLQEDEKQLQGLVEKFNRSPVYHFFAPKINGSFSALKGKLPWPVNGQLINKFGSPRLETRWDGVVIDALEGVDIRAVAKGKVVFADWFKGYGLLVIIDHGAGFMSLYAFNQSLYTDVGATVEPGNVIATVGKSGGRRRAGLYFGIRKKGKAEDPERWCQK